MITSRQELVWPRSSSLGAQAANGDTLALVRPSTSLTVRGILALAVGIVAAWPWGSRSARWSWCSPGARSPRQAWRPCRRSAAAPPAGRRAPAARAGRPGRRRDRAGLAGAHRAVLVLIVASWAVVAGVVEIVAAFGVGEPAGTRALFILAGWSRSRSASCCSPTPARRDHPRAAVRPVQPDLRRLGARAGHRTAPRPARRAVRRAGADRGLSRPAADALKSSQRAAITLTRSPVIAAPCTIAGGLARRPTAALASEGAGASVLIDTVEEEQ